MQIPELAEVVRTYSAKTVTAIAAGEQALFKRHWLKDLVPLMVDAYPAIRLSQGRISILSRLVRWTRDHPEIVLLAQSALIDRSYLVRERACGILAYSLRPDVISSLQVAAAHADRKTRDDAAAAIDAIRHRNHHHYVDRMHTGQSFWLVKPSDREVSDLGG